MVFGFFQVFSFFPGFSNFPFCVVFLRFFIVFWLLKPLPGLKNHLCVFYLCVFWAPEYSTVTVFNNWLLKIMWKLTSRSDYFSENVNFHSLYGCAYRVLLHSACPLAVNIDPVSFDVKIGFRMYLICGRW